MGLDPIHAGQLAASVAQIRKNGAPLQRPETVGLSKEEAGLAGETASRNGIRRVTQEMAAALYAPLPAEAISPHPSKPYLSSIKSIYMIDRLNQVFGIGGWTFRTEIVEAHPDRRMVVVKVTLLIEEYGIILEQFGGNDNEDRGDAFKGAVSDAMSKIAGYLGIGIAVYMGGGPTKQNPRPQPVAPAVPKSLQNTLGERSDLDKLRSNFQQVDRPKQPAPWTKMSEMRAQFARIRERVGEVAYLDALARYGVGTDLVWKNTGQRSASENALACFEELLEQAVQ